MGYVDGQLSCDHQHRYTALAGSRMVKAKVVVHKNRSLSFQAMNDRHDLSHVTIGHTQSSCLMHGDQIRLRIFPGRRQSRAILIAVDQRAMTSFVGQLQTSPLGYVIEPTAPITSALIVLNAPGDVVYDDCSFVKVKIVAYPDDRAPCEVEVDTVLGTLDSPSIIQSMMIQSFNLPHQFSKAARTEAEQIHARGIEIDSDRVDWRSKQFVTIDGADAKDFDDAICVEALQSGWRVFVAISDVSHYIKPGSSLDQEAYTRATSVYLPNSVIPMLPSVLSDGLCSLCPDVDRLVKGLEVILNADGSVQNYRFCKAVIRSKRRLTYAYAQKVIDGVAEGPDWLATMLQHANAVYQLLYANRVHRGALEIDLPFVHMVYDHHDKIQSITRAYRLTTHKIIEELMLLANEITAGHLLMKQAAGVFRNHAEPDTLRLKSLLPFLHARNIHIPARHLDDIKPKLVASIIQQVAALQHGEYLVPMLLSTLAQACYEPINKGHFGLAYQHYCHFTSPIRRYPDLLVHRTLDNLITDRHDAILAESISLKAASEHCSVAERVADDAQKRSIQWLKCCYMLDKIGVVYDATISMVKHFGFFVTIDDLMIDGLVHISCLDGYFTFDETVLSLDSLDCQRSYVVGQSLKVRVTQVNVMSQSIDLALA